MTKLDFSPISMHSYNLALAFGMQTPQETFTLRTLAWSLPAKPVIANIGAGTGTSSLAFAESRLDAEIFTIDISKGGPYGGMENEINAFAGLSLSRPVQMLGDSIQVGKAWDLGPLDLCFIDGDHSEEGCSGDLAAWYPHVKAGGLIAFHDYERDEWPAVKTVVDREAKRLKMTLVLRVDTLIIFRKVSK